MPSDRITAHLFMSLVNPSRQPIAGEAVVEGYEGQIVLDGWNWGVEREKKEDDSQQAVPKVFSFSKELDRSTPTLLMYLHSGGVLPSAEITLEEAADVDFELVLRLERIRVLKYKLDGELDDTDGRLIENWDFDYRRIDLLYKPNHQRSARTKSGVMQASLERPLGSSTEAVKSGGKVEAKITELVKGQSPAEVRSLFDRVVKDLQRPAPPAPSGKKPN